MGCSSRQIPPSDHESVQDIRLLVGVEASNTAAEECSQLSTLDLRFACNACHCGDTGSQVFRFTMYLTENLGAIQRRNHIDSTDLGAEAMNYSLFGILVPLLDNVEYWPSRRASFSLPTDVVMIAGIHM